MKIVSSQLYQVVTARSPSQLGWLEWPQTFLRLCFVFGEL